MVIYIMRQPWAMLIRIPLGILLCIGGLLAFLPILGLWMLPLGLLLLSIDLPFLQRPMNGLILRGERQFNLWRRNRRDKKAAREKTPPEPTAPPPPRALPKQDNPQG